MKLFGYWRSGATYRVRIALALKQLSYEYIPVNLLKGEQKGESHHARNPQKLVPAFETDDGALLTQSLAIMEYLEEAFPAHPLWPADAAQRAKARAIAYAIACEAQPFGNLRVQKYLKGDMALADEKVAAWVNHWTGATLRAVAKMVDETGGNFCAGDQPGIGDALLVPQLYAARRFKVDLTGCERLVEIDAACQKLPAFIKAHPDNQEDAVKQ